MSLNICDQEYNSGKKYRQNDTLCGPNRNNIGFIFLSFFLNSLASSFSGILCSMIDVSYVLRSS
jgi:hypothetical protein